MTQEKINKYFKSEIGQQCESLFTTSDDRVFIRYEEAAKHRAGALDPNTKPLEDQSIIEWFEETEEYPIQDDYWPSRRWNETRTDYIDLSGSDHTVKAIHWGETITISNQDGFLCFVNPYGNRDGGVPSLEDRAIAKQIVEAVNKQYFS